MEIIRPQTTTVLPDTCGIRRLQLLWLVENCVEQRHSVHQNQPDTGIGAIPEFVG